MRNVLINIQNITFELTNRCNLHCRICNIWKERPVKNLPLRDIQKMLSTFPRLSNISLTGGEPLLYPNINLLYRFLYSLYLQNRLHCIDIATNASSPAFPAFLQKHSELLTPLSLSISIDGIADTHDKQRGTCGAFTSVIKNIQIAKTYAIPITIKFVASSLNYTQLPHIARLAQQLGCKFDFKLIEQVPAYYHRKQTSRLPLLNTQQKKALAKVIHTLSLTKNASVLETLSLSWHKKYFQSGNLAFIHHCLTPEKTLFVTTHGDIYNCLYQNKIGTLTGYPEKNSSLTAKNNIQRGRKGTCPKCLSYHGSLKTYNVRSKNPKSSSIRHT